MSHTHLVRERLRVYKCRFALASVEHGFDRLGESHGQEDAQEDAREGRPHPHLSLAWRHALWPGLITATPVFTA